MSSSREPAATVSRERLIESHLPLVQAAARRYLGRGEELEDLVQVGAVGLVKAADRFDAERGVRFGTFASAVIDGEIRRHLRDRTSTMRIPRDVQRTGAEVRRCREELGAKLGRSPTTREIAAALETEERYVERALVAELARETLPLSREEDERVRPGTPGSPESSDIKLLLASGARALDDRERRIVLLRFHGDMTEREIAREVGVSQAHVSRLLDGALSKLRQELDASEGPGDPADIAAERPISRDSGPRIDDVGGPEESPTRSPPREASKKRGGSGHSGRFLVRMPGELHERLARAAERDQVSLNRYVTDVLAASVESDASGERAGDEPEPERGAAGSSQRPPPRVLRVALATNLVIVVVAGLIAVALLVLALQRGI